MHLQVNEIFSSINGEVCHRHQGSLCTFVRLQGCNLRCVYCDTARAQDFEEPNNVRTNSKTMDVKEVALAIKHQGNVNVTITGGEPLLQIPSLTKLLKILLREKYVVSIETNGSIPFPDYEPWWSVYWVVDYKLPYSGVCMDMKDDNFKMLGFTDIVKYVVSSYSDFVFAERRTGIIKEACLEWLHQYPIFAFSPCKGKMEPETLFTLMSKSPLLKEVGAVLSLQLHKIIGVS